MKKKRILAVSGSVRKSSSNYTILRALAEELNEEAEVTFFDGIDKLPHFNPDLDNINLPLTVGDFRRQIEAADALVICTPEYVFSLPGSLKNAIEWNVSTTLLSGKPLAMIVASASGIKAFDSLYLVLKTLECRIAEDSNLLIQGVKGKIDTNGELKDEATKEALKRVSQSLLKTINEME